MDIDVVLVFQNDKAVVFVALAGHVLYTIQGGKAVFQRLGHIAFHLFRAGAGVGGNDQQVGQVHIGQQVCLHAGQAYKSQHHHQYDRHKYGKWLFNTVFWHLFVPFARTLGGPMLADVTDRPGSGCPKRKKRRSAAQPPCGAPF